VPAPEFVALADMLRTATGGLSPAGKQVSALDVHRSNRAMTALDVHGVAELGPPAVVTADPVAADTADALDTAVSDPDVLAAARDARLFRARLADAFDDALARLVRELAADVLVRELRLAPCDLAALAQRVRERVPVVRVRVAPADAARDYGLPALADPALQAGDAVFELAGGALDARLGVRLAAVLDELSAPPHYPGRGVEP
jgi:hypothetical protein